MPPFNVLVCGAGIAGNAIAFWLTRNGYTVTVIERHPKLRTSGLQIDLRGHGIAVLKRMGLEEAFRAYAVPEQGLQVVDSKSRCWAYFPTNRSSKGSQAFTSDYEIMRGDLCRILYDIASKKAKYFFGTTVIGVKHASYGVKVQFSNHTTSAFDLIIGADGVSSQTRRLMLDLASLSPDPSLKPLGDQETAYFAMPSKQQVGEQCRCSIYMTTQHRSIMTRRHNSEEVQIYLSRPIMLTSFAGDTTAPKARPPPDASATKASFITTFRNTGYKSQEICDTLAADTENKLDFYVAHPELVKLERWSNSASDIILVGDAAYCPTANTGMGTTAAIVGAYVLAGELTKHIRNDGFSKHDVRNALEAYEETLHPFTTALQDGVDTGTGAMDYIPSGSIGVWLLNLFFAIAALLRLNVFETFILKEGAVKDWKLPEYEGLRSKARAG